MSGLRVESCAGNELAPYLGALAALRIEVFRDYPYLYEGTLAYEERYLKDYTKSQESLAVLVFDGAEVVGASTGMPLVDHGESVVEPLARAGLDPARVFYFGESVLRRGYRGRGLGHAFFDRRERFARERGYRNTAFCAVERPAAHPARPSDYRPLDAFWRARGYEKHPAITARFAWRDVGDTLETDKPMVFWLREWIP